MLQVLEEKGLQNTPAGTIVELVRPKRRFTFLSLPQKVFLSFGRWSSEEREGTPSTFK